MRLAALLFTLAGCGTSLPTVDPFAPGDEMHCFTVTARDHGVEQHAVVCATSEGTCDRARLAARAHGSMAGLRGVSRCMTASVGLGEEM
jgi:hypothetical protein